LKTRPITMFSFSFSNTQNWNIDSERDF